MLVAPRRAVAAVAAACQRGVGRCVRTHHVGARPRHLVVAGVPSGSYNRAPWGSCCSTAKNAATVGGHRDIHSVAAAWAAADADVKPVVAADTPQLDDAVHEARLAVAELRIRGEGGEEMAVAQVGLGEALLATSDLEGAAEALSAGLDSGLLPPEAHLVALSGLATVQAASGELDAAGEGFEQALAYAQKTLSPDDLRVADVLVRYSMVLRQLEQFTRQAEVLETALGIQVTQLGEDNVEVAMTLGDLGMAFLQLRGSKSGRPLMEDALAKLDSAGCGNLPGTAPLLRALGQACSDDEDLELCAHYWQRALDITGH